MSDEYTALADFFLSIWDLFRTPMELPWIGETTPLGIMVFLAVGGYLADMVAKLLGGKDA